jgi:glucose-1-phosphatase
MSSPALLFDIGNVLVSFDFSRCARALAAHSPLGEADILEAISPLKDPLESGQCSSETFVAQSMTAIRYQGSAEDFRQAWCDIFAPLIGMAETLATLPKKLPAYLLSNTSGLHKDFLLQNFDIFQHFQGGIFSHEAKTMKPAPGMYEQAIAKFGLDPAQTYYVDDLAANIETGRSLGFVSFHYDPTQHQALDLALRQWLASLPA